MGKLSHIRRLINTAEEIECSNAQDLMSPFIDSMTTPEETEWLQDHIAACSSCQRQLQLYISVKNVLSRVENPEPPEDLSLTARILLSHERTENRLERLETHLGNFLRPIVVPAVLGVSFTALFFGVLLTALSSSATVMANDRLDVPIYSSKPVRMTDNTSLRFAENSGSFEDPLTVETFVGDDGRVIDFRILAGPSSPAIDRWLRELLYFSDFSPATVLGRPVGSRVILSFVGVRS